jgi:cold shock CspA family protein
MIKVMLFVDGPWLLTSWGELAPESGRGVDFPLDFAKLPRAILTELDQTHGLPAVDLVRCHFVGAPSRFEPREEGVPRPFLPTPARMRADYGYEVETSWSRRSMAEPEGERRAAVALSVLALRNAYQIGAMDLALVVTGERDLVPLLQELRRLGKRVALASIEGHCAEVLLDAADPEGVRDFDVVWLNELSARLEQRGDPRRHARRTRAEAAPIVDDLAGKRLRGEIKNVIWDRGYGFIAAEDGRDYFFHANALEEGLTFEEIQPEMAVVFEIKSGPAGGRAGAARMVARDIGQSTDATEGEEPDGEDQAEAVEENEAAAADVHGNH